MASASSAMVLAAAVGVLAAGFAAGSRGGALAAEAPPATLSLALDAREAPLKILHARMRIPVKAGPLTLVYPKWIPGEHAPTGPIVDLAGLRFSAGGKTLAWRRDPEDMFALTLDIPPGASELEARFDYLSPPAAEGFSSAASATANLAIVSWNQVLLYPKGMAADTLKIAASAQLPEGWKYATALPVERETEAGVEFAPVSLATLVDSPVLAGAYFRTLTLTSGSDRGGSVEIDIAADSKAALEIPQETAAKYERLVEEINALFGARHYRRYRFLVSLSDGIAHFGLEHHESSDDRSWERALVDPDHFALMAGLLPHEFVHSWNGKYRRPQGLITRDLQQAQKTELLWVYEGLTTYLGNVLTARSALRTPEQYRESLALDAAKLDQKPGRTWRPLADTAVAAQLLYDAREGYSAWRRGVDFYPEGDLIWLEADVIIRQRSNGRRSLDDFCRRFHGGPGGPPAVKAYTFDDVVAALNETLAYDWRSFFETRLTSTAPRAPLGGIEGSGWRLAYTDAVPGYLKSIEEVREIVDLSFSIGLKLDKKEGRIIDVVPGLPAAQAGIAPGMKIVAVNGRKWSKEILRAAIKAAANPPEPLDLLVENSEIYKTYRLDYRGGERYPVLQRDSERPDLLSEILKPLRAP